MLHKDILMQIILEYKNLKAVSENINDNIQRKIFNNQLKKLVNSISRLDLESESAYYNVLHFDTLIAINKINYNDFLIYIKSQNIPEKEIDPILSTWQPEYHIMNYLQFKKKS